MHKFRNLFPQKWLATWYQSLKSCQDWTDLTSLIGVVNTGHSGITWIHSWGPRRLVSTQLEPALQPEELRHQILRLPSWPRSSRSFTGKFVSVKDEGSHACYPLCWPRVLVSVQKWTKTNVSCHLCYDFVLLLRLLNVCSPILEVINSVCQFLWGKKSDQISGLEDQ